MHETNPYEPPQSAVDERSEANDAPLTRLEEAQLEFTRAGRKWAILGTVLCAVVAGLAISALVRLASIPSRGDLDTTKVLFAKAANAILLVLCAFAAYCHLRFNTAIARAGISPSRQGYERVLRQRRWNRTGACIFISAVLTLGWAVLAG